jgi:hypothetical protein
MRPFAIGLTAALALAILIPAAVISAPKEEKGKPAAIDAKARETGMKEAPAIIRQRRRLHRHRRPLHGRGQEGWRQVLRSRL